MKQENQTMAQTMAPTMAPNMIPNNNHTDIPGNPSTATSSKISLSDRSSGQPLRVLSEEDWIFCQSLLESTLPNACSAG